MVRTLIALSIFSLLAACAGDPSVAATNDAVPEFASASAADDAERPAVDLAPSFRIAEDDGAADVSHAPCVCVTPDRKRLVVGTNTGEMVVFDAGDQSVDARHQLGAGKLRCGELARGGEVLVCLSGEGSLVVADVASGRVEARQEVAGAEILVVAPDGTRCAVARGNVVEVRDVASLELKSRHETAAEKITGLAWHPTRPAIAATGKCGRLLLVDASTGAVLEIARKPGPLYAVAFSPDGQLIAFGGEEKVIYVANADGSGERVIAKNQPYWITTLGFSPDSRLLLVGDESCDVWLRDVQANGKLLFHGKHHIECWVNQVAWTGDDTFMLACRPNGHAGKPTVAMQNVYREASQASEARAAQRVSDAARAALVDAIVAEASPETEHEIAELRARLGMKAGAEKELLLALAGGRSTSALLHLGAVEGPGLPPGASLSPSSGGFYANGSDGDVRAATENVFDRVLGDLLSSNGGSTVGFQAVSDVGSEFRGLGGATPGAVHLLDDRTMIAPAKNVEEAKARQQSFEALSKRIAATPGVAKALKEAQAADRKHADAIKAAGDKLKAGFTINQWRVQR